MKTLKSYTNNSKTEVHKEPLGNIHNQYENSQNINTIQQDDLYNGSPKSGLEIQELKQKLKIITNKLQVQKKENDKLKNDNKQYQQELLTLQADLRQMIPGFSNTSQTFPMMNELATLTNEFYKYDCVDIFFDLLCPELNFKGIVYFYITAFSKIQQLVKDYFQILENQIKKTGCLENIEGPILNVIRKSFQSTYKEIQKKCLTKQQLTQIQEEIQNNLKLEGGQESQANEQIFNFLQKLGELFVQFYICDPPLYPNTKIMGAKIAYNSLKHDPLDGFLKAKEESIIILPSLHKQNQNGEIMSKALVLAINYEIPNN